VSNENTFNAVVNLDINAPISKVWEALTKPELIKQYMHDTNTVTDWQVGSPISWKGEWQGKPYEDKGVILDIEAPKLLKYTHWSPLGGSEDKPENYHTVTYELISAGETTKLTLTQGNNPSQEAADKMAKSAWEPMMQSLKRIAES
jgi:uncharacterized protein YndB with AHSA1/START domain